MVSRKKLLVFLTIFTSTIYIIWRTVRTLPFEFGWFSIFCGLFLLIVEIMGFFEMIVHFQQLSDPLVLGETPELEVDEYPDVDIFISTYNEPEDLLFKTINACLNMDYPDKSKVHIYLCDDGNRDEMGVLARKLGVTHLVRDTHKHAKAGNLNHAMKMTSSPYIVTFDADMIPRRHFLMRTLPYFVRDQKIGFIQTPQTFYNPDLFQYNLYSEKSTPNEQDYFYRDVQVMRNRSNSVIYGGTNTILSREALEAAGGFFVGVITEDFATGMMIQAKGFKSFAIDEGLAVGMAPEDLKSLINQRRRWARGCIQTGKKINLLFVQGLDWRQKVSYLTSITYWLSPFKQLAYVMAPILYALFGVIVVKTSILEVAIFWLPMYLFNNYTLKQLSDGIRNTHLTNVYEMILFPSLLPSVFLELIGVSMTTFKVTRKDSAQKFEEQDRRFKLQAILPHAIFAMLSLAAIVVSVRQTLLTGTPAYVIIIFWVALNFYNLTMSIFFMLGRKSYRRYERFAAEVPVVIRFDNRLLRTRTYDISEAGLSVEFDFPEWVPSDRTVEIELRTEFYTANLIGQVMNVFPIDGRWRFGFDVEPQQLADRQAYLQIIYDREHSLPKYIVENYGSITDWVHNFQSRMSKQALFSRRLPRLNIQKMVRTDQGFAVKLCDFNYDYLTLAIDQSVLPRDTEGNILVPGELSLLEAGFVIECERVDLPLAGMYAYQIVNRDEIMSQPSFRSLLANWMDYYNEMEDDRTLYQKKIDQYLKESTS